MHKTWLVLDVSSLAYRSLYTTGKLSFGGDYTGVLFGFFRDMHALSDYFATDRFVFAFDSKNSLREREFPAYKSARRKKFTNDPALSEQSYAMKKQVKRLHFDFLPEIGYRNLFVADGYEADDVMAAVRVPEGDAVVYVSGDTDTFQLIGPRAAVWYAKDQVLWDLDRFGVYYGISPKDWPKVKALAGDASDSVPGVKGVGPKSALAYYQGKDVGPNYRRLITESFETRHYEQMLRLVTVPYPNCPKFRPTGGEQISQRGWKNVMRSLGIRTLPHYPGATLATWAN